MRRLFYICLPLAALSLSACLGTVADVVTAPVSVASKGVDMATTSQSEADEKRGRELRKREERLGKLERKYEKQMKRCQNGDRNACATARDTYAEMQQIIPTLPAEPDDN